MPPAKSIYNLPSEVPTWVPREDDIEYGFIGKLQDLKYEYRPDITDRATLERNFREKFEALNRVLLIDGEFDRLLDEIWHTTGSGEKLTSFNVSTLLRDNPDLHKATLWAN